MIKKTSANKIFGDKPETKRDGKNEKKTIKPQKPVKRKNSSMQQDKRKKLKK